MRVVKLLLLLFLVGVVLPRAGPAEVAQDDITCLADLSPPIDLAVAQSSEHGIWSVAGVMLMERAAAPRPELIAAVRFDAVTSMVPIAILTQRDIRQSLATKYEHTSLVSTVALHLRL